MGRTRQSGCPPASPGCVRGTPRPRRSAARSPQAHGRLTCTVVLAAQHLPRPALCAAGPGRTSGAWPASHGTSRLTLPSTCLLKESRGAHHSGCAGEGRGAVRRPPGGGRAGRPRLTFRELSEQVAALAAALVSEGIEPGDRVAIWSPNTHHWVLAALAAQTAGAALVPVNTRFTGAEALEVIGRSSARVLFVAGSFLGTDRLAALWEAQLAEPGELDRLRLIVSIPVEAGATAEGADRPATTGPGTPWPAATVLDWAGLQSLAAQAATGLAAERALPSARMTSATSCSPPVRPGGARVR